MLAWSWKHSGGLVMSRFLTVWQKAMLATVGLCLVAQPPSAALAQQGSRVVSSREIGDYPNRGGFIGVRLGDEVKMAKRDGTPFVCMTIAKVDVLGAARRAGLASGDRLCAVDGIYFETGQVLGAYLGSLTPGSEATLSYSPPDAPPIQADVRIQSFADLSIPWRLRVDGDAGPDRGGDLGFVESYTSGTLYVRQNGDPQRYKVYVRRIDAGSLDVQGVPAIGVGDGIYSIDDLYFDSERSFDAYVRSREPGSRVRLIYAPRGGGPDRYVVVALGRRDPAAVAGKAPAPNEAGGSDVATGVAVGVGVAAAAVILYKIFSGDASSGSSYDPDAEYQRQMEGWEAQGCSLSSWQSNPNCGPPPQHD